MARVLRCYNFASDCTFEIRAETDEELLRIAEDHGRNKHNMAAFTEETKARLLAFVTDED